jgi:tetratricopeptide (TPR) repeat protein
MNLSRAIPLLFLLGILAIPGGSADNFAAIQHYNQAVDLATAGQYDEALQEVDLALQENQNFTLALVTKAGILNVLGRYQEAVQAADQAIELEPDEAAAWNNRAFALIRLGNYDDGLIAAQKAAALDQNMTEAWVNEGTALIRLGRYQEALTASEKALALDPNSTDAELNRDEALANLQTGTMSAPLAGEVVLGGVALTAVLFFRGWGHRRNR